MDFAFLTGVIQAINCII